VLSRDRLGDTGTDGRPPDLSGKGIDTLESRHGNRFLLEPAPDETLPPAGMPAEDAISEACETLKVNGRLHESDRERVKTNTGY
jgi:hypothetical protein